MIRWTVSWKDPTVIMIVGLALREAFSFWTGHPYDTEVWIRNAVYVSRGMSPYSFMDPVPGLSFYAVNQRLPSVGYPPLWSLMLAGLYRSFALLPTNNRFIFYFLIKQPPILGDVFLGYVLYRAALLWGGTAKASRTILRFWMLFPYPILISAIWGQFDALVTFLWVASLLTVRPVKRSVLDGLAILLKLVPVIFIPYHLLRDRGRVKFRQAVTVAVPIVFTAGAFYVGGWGFESFSQTMVYTAHGFPIGMSILGLLFSPFSTAAIPGMIPAFVFLQWLWAPAVLIASIYASRRFSQQDSAGMVQALLFISLVFFLFRVEVNEQYLLYLLPLLLLDVILWHPERMSLFHTTWTLALVYLVFNNDFLIRFFGPVSQSALDLSYTLDNNSVFGPWRGVILVMVAMLFVIHLAQLALVICDANRSATPWLVQAVQRIRRLTRVRRGPAGHLTEDPPQ